MIINNEKDPVISRKVFSENIRWLYPLHILESRLSPENSKQLKLKSREQGLEKEFYIGGAKWKLPI